MSPFSSVHCRPTELQWFVNELILLYHMAAALILKSQPLHFFVSLVEYLSSFTLYQYVRIFQVYSVLHREKNRHRPGEVHVDQQFAERASKNLSERKPT